MKSPHWARAARLGLFLGAVSTLGLLSACRKPAAASVGAMPNAESIFVDPAKRAQFEWNLKTTLGAYTNIGKSDRRWDQPAKTALIEFARARTGVTEPDERVEAIIADNAEAAVKAGCDDPLIEYLHARYCLGNSREEGPARVEAYLKAAADLQSSLYPIIRKYYGSFRAYQQIRSVYGYTNLPPAMEQFITGNALGANLQAVVEDGTAPPEEVFEVGSEFLELYRYSKNGLPSWYKGIEAAVFRHWPNESVSWLLKGIGYTYLAWLDRGSGYADSVTEEGWKGFKEKLAVAKSALEKAWDLNPKDARIAMRMMTVELGQGTDRKQMELWFGRAMEINPRNVEACRLKLNYLQPKWFGSRDEMLAFGRECVASEKWSGDVPLVLVDAHIDCAGMLAAKDAEAYWKLQEVWPDIKSAYEKFFQLNPQATGLRHNYAMFAYRCGQWEDLNTQLGLLGKVDYEFFGGKEEYDRMVALVKEHTGGK